MELRRHDLRNQHPAVFPAGNVRRGRRTVAPAERPGRGYPVDHARSAHRPGKPEGGIGELLFHSGLHGRQSRIRYDGRLPAAGEEGPRSGHEGDSGLGGQPHGLGFRLGGKRNLVRAGFRREAGFPLRLDGRGGTRLRQPRDAQGHDGRHDLLDPGSRRGRLPGRYGAGTAGGLPGSWFPPTTGRTWWNSITPTPRCARP